MRLIDADNYKGKVIASHCYSGVIKLVSIDDVPTAYDVDKVVAELEKKRDKLSEKGCCLSAKQIKDAIEIVKAGGNS